jgi:hypothetical protein
LASLPLGFDDKYKSDEKTLSPWMGFLWHMDAEAIKKVAGHFKPNLYPRIFQPQTFEP